MNLIRILLSHRLISAAWTPQHVGCLFALLHPTPSVLMARVSSTAVIGGRTLPVIRCDREPILLPAIAPIAEIKRLAYLGSSPNILLYVRKEADRIHSHGRRSSAAALRYCSQRVSRKREGIARATSVVYHGLLFCTQLW
jgi:hypothetical protein